MDQFSDTPISNLNGELPSFTQFLQLVGLDRDSAFPPLLQLLHTEDPTLPSLSNVDATRQISISSGNEQLRAAGGALSSRSSAAAFNGGGLRHLPNDRVTNNHASLDLNGSVPSLVRNLNVNAPTPLSNVLPNVSQTHPSHYASGGALIPTSTRTTGANSFQNLPSAPRSTAQGIQGMMRITPLHRQTGPVSSQGNAVSTAPSVGSSKTGPSSSIQPPVQQHRGETTSTHLNAPVGVQGKMDLRIIVNGGGDLLNQPNASVWNRGKRTFETIVNGADASTRLDGPVHKKAKMDLTTIVNATDVQPFQYAASRQRALPSNITSNTSDGNAPSVPGPIIIQDDPVDFFVAPNVASSSSYQPVQQYGATGVLPQSNNWAQHGDMERNLMYNSDPGFMTPSHPSASFQNATLMPMINTARHDYNYPTSGSSAFTSSQGNFVNHPAFMNVVPNSFQPNLTQHPGPPVFTQSDWVTNSHDNVVSNTFNNQAGLNVGSGQPSIHPPHIISTTEHGTPTTMPNASDFSTSEASTSIDPMLLQQPSFPWGQGGPIQLFNKYRVYPDSRIEHFFSPNHPSLYTLTPASTSTSQSQLALSPLTNAQVGQVTVPGTPKSSPPYSRKRGRKPKTQKHNKALEPEDEGDQKVLPSATLYYINEAGKFVCKYVGPACTTGCFQENSDLRCLIRHLQKHAREEIRLNVAEGERVACNGMPDEILRPSVSCGLPDTELHKCKYFRENKERWVVKTMERWEKVMDEHKRENHDPEDASATKCKRRKRK